MANFFLITRTNTKSRQKPSTMNPGINIKKGKQFVR